MTEQRHPFPQPSSLCQCGHPQSNHGSEGRCGAMIAPPRRVGVGVVPGVVPVVCGCNKFRPGTALGFEMNDEHIETAGQRLAQSSIGEEAA